MSDADNSGNAGRVPMVFSTPVWGAGHLGLFLNVGLPSLLAGRNLPALSGNTLNRYLIYTRPEDEYELKESPAFQRLTGLMQVEVSILEREITEPHRTMSNCHLDSLRRADESQAAAVFLPPDCIWSDGSIARLEDLVRAGKSMVHMSGIRLDRDAFVPELANHYFDRNTVLTIGSRDLVAAALPHLHPIALTHFWNEYDGGLMPANLIWTVPGEGLLLRCFHLHPLMVKSQVPFAKFDNTIDDDLALHTCPDSSRDYVVQDSDELLAFELSGLSRVVGTVCAKGSIEGVAEWAEVGTNIRHRELIRRPIRLHSGTLRDEMWTKAEIETGKIVTEILAINEYSTLNLAFSYPAVFFGRIFAISLGKGTHGNRFVGVAWFIRALRKVLIHWASASYNALFVRNGRLIITHPAWLIRREAIAAIAVCIGHDDRHVILIGVDPGLALDVEMLRPNTKIQAFSSNSVPDPSMVHREGSGDVDLLLTVDVRGQTDPKRQRVGKRRALIRIVGDTRAVPLDYETAFYISGIGTRFCSALLNFGSGIRNRIRQNAAVRGILIKAVAYAFLPLIYGMIAVGGLIMNLIGLVLNGIFGAGPRLKSAERPTSIGSPL